MLRKWGKTKGKKSRVEIPDVTAPISGQGGIHSSYSPSAVSSETTSSQGYVGLWQYTARTKEDLSFMVNEHLEILSKRSGWWYARSLATGKTGFIPSNYIAPVTSIGAQPWYFGPIKRIEAERVLLQPDNKDGAFLVRVSESRMNEYSLSVRVGLSVKHYKISFSDGDKFYISRSYIFPDIQSLVTFYKRERNGLCTKLERSCHKIHQPETEGLSYLTQDQWEIDRGTLTLSEVLGKGQFGEVWKAYWNKTTPVAIKKMIPDCMDKEEFLAEAQMMKRLRHPNLIQLYAVCTKEEPILIITELMVKGSLLHYLRGDEGRALNLVRMGNIGYQVALGMCYLEGKNYIHRDLAARNVLVGNNNIVKVADFGLSRLVKEGEYTAMGASKLPIRWTSPEALKYHRFSVKSDVWSFGILLWEIITHGTKPYPRMENDEVVEYVNKGERMKEPNYPRSYYNIMQECWNHDPDRRPTFKMLTWKLEDFTTMADYREFDEVK
ncbi:tyrosine-protein kinase Src42A [Oratosquilla oratoria]|uniref:tyrosine-protein kinase Src42A n=1 Tax=Oratosquilla oratoria TaxID=337810 RepID=UPI003F7660AC